MGSLPREGSLAERDGPTLASVVLARETPFTIGELLVEPAFRRVTRGDGARQTLEPLVMQVLVALARADGGIVSRDELIERCWGGRIVGDDSISRVIFRLRKLAGEFAQDAFAIETTAKVGFRLVGEVVKAAPARKRTRQRTDAPAPRWPLVAVLVAVLLGVVGFVAYNPARPGPVAIAVLPFTAQGAADRYLADGLSEEIARQLAREPGLEVAGRNSSRQFAGREADLRDAGRRLEVDYVLHGEVRRDGDRLRASATLSDARTAGSVWSQTFGEAPDAALRVQDRIALRVLAALPDRARESPKTRKSLTTSAEVSELRLTALGMMRERNPGNLADAVRLLRRAVTLDPGYAPGWASLGAAIKLEWSCCGEPSGRAAAVSEATQTVQRALTLAPNLAEAHAALGMIWDFEPRGLRHLERAVALAPDDAQAWYWLYLTRDKAGDFAGALAAAREMARLDPFWAHSRWYPIYAWSLGRRDEAAHFYRMLGRRQADPYLRQSAAAQHAYMRGDLSEAYRLSSAAAREAPIGLRELASRSPATNLVRMGLLDQALRTAVIPEPVVQLLKGRAPSLAELARVFPDLRTFWEARDMRVLTLRHLLRDKRPGEIVTLYDVAFDSPAAMMQPSQAGAAARIDDASYVAIALRAVGREGEARELLARAGARAAPATRGGPVPAPMLAAYARIAAARGQRDAALGALERAVANGWAYEDYSIVPRLGEDPAFAVLASEPRLIALDRRIQSALARERRETLALLGRTTTT